MLKSLATFAILIGTITTANAGSSATNVPFATVSHADLDLASAQGQKIFKKRIGHVVVKLCAQHGGSDMFTSHCVRSELKRAHPAAQRAIARAEASATQLARR